MDTDIVLAPADQRFDEFLAEPAHGGRMRHVVVTEGQRILGVLRVNTALRHAAEAAPAHVAGGPLMRDLASRHFTVVGEGDIVADVIRRIWRRHAMMALVVARRGVPRAADIAGVITKEHVADSVASSLRMYPD